MDWITHDEDVWYEFRGDDPHQLQPGRFYRGTVDGYADFGVFVDITRGVTGLLHRSELDQRLESLDWEPGDTVFVQVKNVRENGNVDLAWSKRQRESEFRGARIHDPDGEHDGEPIETESEAEEKPTVTRRPAPPREESHSEPESSEGAESGSEGAESGSESSEGAESGSESSEGAESGSEAAESAPETNTEAETDADPDVEAETDTSTEPAADLATESTTGEPESTTGEPATPSSTGSADTAEAAETAGTADAADAAEAGEGESRRQDRGVSEAGGAQAGRGQAAVARPPERTGTVTGAEPEGAETTETTETAEIAETAESAEPEPPARVSVEALSDHVGEQVRIEGEIVGARQTGGPTVFELRDETGVVDVAAFVEAGVRAYPEVEPGDVVRLDGEVELRREELQVETETLTALEGDEREEVVRRMAAAMTEKARPAEVRPLGGHPAVEAVVDEVADAAEAIRRAVLESRPIVVRHAATADGYIAGAAIERAVLPLIGDEHAQAAAAYHFFDRRPLEDAVYGMDDATTDVTRMLQDVERHDEKLPLVVLVGTGATEPSIDGLELLGLYDAPRVVLDAAPADAEVAEVVETLVNPGLAGAGADAGDLSTAALAATLAAAVNDDARGDLRHLPAASYWEGAPETYVDLATEAGWDADDLRELREAIALEAFYQSYEGKRELVTDLLFDEVAVAGDPDAARGLASHVSEQFRAKLDTELETARANLETHETGGVRFAELDADAYTHRYDFPPTTLLLDELHRRERGDGPFVTLALGMDELYVRTTGDVDVRDVAAQASEYAEHAGISALGVREGRIEFLSGRRDEVRDAVIASLAELVE